MAVTLSSDIIMDVARAADPSEVSAARQRLAAIAQTGGATAEFETATTVGNARAAVPTGGPEAFERFEAFVLQTFLESMMPDDSESVFGSGLAGGMWKSMMAEQLADQMARSGGIGIADRILTDYYARGEEKVALSGVTGEAEKREAEKRNLASQSLVHEIQRRVGGALGQQGDALLTDRKAG